MREETEVGYQALVSDGGARNLLQSMKSVRLVWLYALRMYWLKLDRRLRQAIGHAHDAEERDT
jgi:hypothetical protein